MKKYLKSFLKTIFSFNFIREKFDKLASFYFENVCSEEIERIYHFEKYKLGKQGGTFIDFEFPEADAKALQKVVKMIAKENILIAEIGSWKGMSTVILAKSIAPYQGKVFAVDHWKGSEGVIHHEIAKKIDIFQIFRENISYFGVENLVYPLIMDSLTAASIFADEILDLVYIDADHRYEFVKKDILAWLPKIKKGGIICGHDSENYYSSFPEHIKKKIDENLNKDFLPEIPCHPGVIKALYEIFKDKHSMVPNSKIWFIRKYN